MQFGVFWSSKHSQGGVLRPDVPDNQSHRAEARSAVVNMVSSIAPHWRCISRESPLAIRVPGYKPLLAISVFLQNTIASEPELDTRWA